MFSSLMLKFTTLCWTDELLLSQGYASLNDTPHMVVEQTRGVVDSK